MSKKDSHPYKPQHMREFRRGRWEIGLLTGSLFLMILGGLNTVNGMAESNAAESLEDRLAGTDLGSSPITESVLSEAEDAGDISIILGVGYLTTGTIALAAGGTIQSKRHKEQEKERSALMAENSQLAEENILGKAVRILDDGFPLGLES